jgi:GT2 family glycosyltransferase
VSSSLHRLRGQVPKVAIVIVNWNGYDDTVECLDSLLNLEYSNYFVVVVDNGSSDDSERKLRDKYPQHIMLQAQSNRGFAAGSNIGIRRALEEESDFVLLLNNDCRVEPMLLMNLIHTCESHPKIGMVGGRVDYASRPNKVWACGGAFNVNTGQAKHFLSEKEFKEFVPKDAWYTYMPACLLLIKRACIEDIGFLSERFFHLAEDVDYCLRAERSGWVVDLASNASVLHKGSSSLARFSPLYNYYEQRNRLFVIRQYRIRTKSLRLMTDPLIIFTRVALTLITIDRWTHLPEGARFLCLALFDFLRGRDGKHENHPGDHTIPAVS